MTYSTAAVALMGLVSLASATMEVPAKRYQCNEPTGTCMPMALDTAATAGMSRQGCQATCGAGTLWPLPRSAKGENAVASTLVKASCQVKFDVPASGIQSLLKQAAANFEETLSRQSNGCASDDGQAVSVKFVVADTETTELALTTDESYTLAVADGVATITSKTFYGARHGLETLSQLFVWDETNKIYEVPSTVTIEDAPALPYRGLMIDTSRQFLPVSFVKETIRAMSYNKVNTLHWHLSDTSSFSVETPSQPNITSYGAYGPDMYYSTADIEDITAFANSHGVRIIPEVDIPAHVNHGWEWGPAAGKGELMVCASGIANPETANWWEHALEPPTGQLNIANPHVPEILGDVYSDILSAFGSPSMFHLGGDEVIIGKDGAWASCWNMTGNPVQQAVIDNFEGCCPGGLSDKESFYNLWVDFTIKATKKLEEAYAKKGKSAEKILQWAGNHLSEPVIYNIFMYDKYYKKACPVEKFMPIIWDWSVSSEDPWYAEGTKPSMSLTKKLIEDGYDVVLANTDFTYLDCGGPGWVRPGGYWCPALLEWYKLYDYLPAVKQLWGLTELQMKKIQGATTLIWGETADSANVHQKIWPRSAALAERLWSNPEYNADGKFVDERFQLHRHRMTSRGIPGQALQPRWCIENGQSCSIPGFKFGIPDVPEAPAGGW